MKILLIGEDGKMLGNFEFREAERLASSKGMSLALMDKKNGAVYKLVDAGKLKYEQKQKDKIQRAQQRAQKIKEIKLRPVIDVHDLDTKYGQIVNFIEDGLKTKVIMSFHGRHIANKEVGVEKFNALINKLIENNICNKEKDAIFEGKNLIITLIPIK